MSEKSANGILSTTIEKVRNLVDVSTIIGEPIYAEGGTTIIPVSKVTYGFASGGADFPSKANQELFGGGGGAGVTISPVGFLVIKNGDVTVKYISEGADSQAERIISMVPDVVNKVTDVVSKFKNDKTEETVDSIFEEV